MFKNGASFSGNIKNCNYKKLSSDDDELWNESEIGGANAIELQKRTRIGNEEGSSPQNIIPQYDTLMEKPIQSGESLASISLKYRIPVSELKRVNKLQKETEFYALNSVKIPVKLNSALYEILQEEIPCSSQEIEVDNRRCLRMSSGSEMESETEMPVGLISISQILREKKTRREAQRFLENMQNDLLKIQEQTETYKDSLDDAATALTNVAFTSREKKGWGCSGADLDLVWWKVLIGGALVIIGVPCIYLWMYS